MPAADNKRIVAEIYRHYAQGDMPFVLDAFSDGIDWHSLGPADAIPWSGAHRGKEGALDYFRRLNEAVEVKAYEVDEILADGDRVVVLARARVLFKSTGQVLDFDKVDVLKLHDGKVAEFREFFDSAKAMLAMQPSRPAPA